MSSEPAPAENEATANPLPHSWISLLAGFAVCIGAAVMCAVVMRQHLATRPLNLRGQTIMLADRVEELFRANFVYPENIVRTDPRLIEGQRAAWYAFTFDVTLEENPPEAFEQILSREMLAQHVNVSRAQKTGDLSELYLTVGGCRFADIRFKVRHAAPEPEQGPAWDAMLRLVDTKALPAPEMAAPAPPAPPAPQAPASSEAETQQAQPAPQAPAPTEPAAPPAPEKPAQTPRVAIILDDAGYGGAASDAALTLDPRLTISVLPGAPRATETAKQFADAKFEVMLHLPMESPEDPGWISTTTPADEMKRLIDEALARVPGAVGINNHMGSTFCTHGLALACFFKVLKPYNLFFIDSRTTHETKIPQFAREAGIPVGERKVFLDNDSDENKIREQFTRLMDFARENGTAVGIGHVRPATVAALNKLLPELEKNGITLVHASEVVQ